MGVGDGNGHAPPLELSLTVEGDGGLSDAHVQALVVAVLAGEGGLSEVGGVVDLGVQWMSGDEIRQLNLDHRDVDAATDVLSFPIDGREALEPGLPRQLGDVVVCVEYVERQVADGTTMSTGDADLEAALARCVVHGVLHLLGEDHEAGDAAAERMYALEQAALYAVGQESG